jgi:hypothetical protein
MQLNLRSNHAPIKASYQTLEKSCRAGRGFIPGNSEAQRANFALFWVGRGFIPGNSEAQRVNIDLL